MCLVVCFAHFVRSFALLCTSYTSDARLHVKCEYMEHKSAAGPVSILRAARAVVVCMMLHIRREQHPAPHNSPPFALESRVCLFTLHTHRKRCTLYITHVYLMCVYAVICFIRLQPMPGYLTIKVQMAMLKNGINQHQYSKVYIEILIAHVLSYLSRIIVIDSLYHNKKGTSPA